MPSFEWDEERSAANKAKHGIDFYHAQYAFFDAHRLFVRDSKHSVEEERWFCIGKVAGKILIVCLQGYTPFCSQKSHFCFGKT